MKIRQIKCVYAIKHNDEIVYIGSTENFYKRLGEHVRCLSKYERQKRLYDYLKTNECTMEIIKETDDYLQLEEELIRSIKPKLNTTLLYTKEERKTKWVKDNHEKIVEYSRKHSKTEKGKAWRLWHNEVVALAIKHGYASTWPEGRALGAAKLKEIEALHN